jgi:hypothetical protein
MEKILAICLILIIIYIIYNGLNINLFIKSNKIVKKKDLLDSYVLPKVVYGFWDNLDENIIIQSHIRSWRRHLSSEWEIIILNKDNVYKYVDESFINKYGSGELDATRFSDFLRIELLTKNGGCWMDASIFILNGKFLDDMYNEMILNQYDGCFYEYKELTQDISQPHIDNWFMMAPKGSKILTDLYYEFTKAFDMGFLKYKQDVLMKTDINLKKTLGYGNDTYLLQHAIFHYLLKDGNPYNIELKNATDSFYLIQLIYNWNNNKVINYIMNKTNWEKMYAVKLTKSNRRAIEDKEAYVRKIDSL